MLARGLTTSARDFSTRILGRSFSYLALLRRGAVTGTIDPLARLLVHLNERGQFELSAAVYESLRAECGKHRLAQPMENLTEPAGPEPGIA